MGLVFWFPTFLLRKFIRQIIGLSFSCSNSALSLIIRAENKKVKFKPVQTSDIKHSIIQRDEGNWGVTSFGKKMKE